MIRKLQKKTVWTIMTVLFLLIFLANLILHLTVLHVSCQMTTHVLQTLAENAETVWNTERFELAEDIPIGTLTIRGDELFNIFTTPLYAAELTDEGEVRFFGEFRNRSPLDSAALTDTLQTLARRKAGGGRVGNYLYYKLKIPGGVADRTGGFQAELRPECSPAADGHQCADQHPHSAGAVWGECRALPLCTYAGGGSFPPPEAIHLRRRA